MSSLGAIPDKELPREDVMETLALPITGGCLGGAVLYEVSEEPYWAGYCHCDICKRALWRVCLVPRAGV